MLAKTFIESLVQFFMPVVLIFSIDVSFFSIRILLNFIHIYDARGLSKISACSTTGYTQYSIKLSNSILSYLVEILDITKCLISRLFAILLYLTSFPFNSDTSTMWCGKLSPT